MEAKKLWLSQNTWYFAITGLDMCLVERWLQFLETCDVATSPCVRFGESFDWSNLVQWCKYVWQNERANITIMGRGPSLSAEMRIVNAAQTIAAQDRNQPWDDVERTLTAYRDNVRKEERDREMELMWG